jgi:hypothetical protein
MECCRFAKIIEPALDSAGHDANDLNNVRSAAGITTGKGIEELARLVFP